MEKSVREVMKYHGYTKYLDESKGILIEGYNESLNIYYYITKSRINYSIIDNDNVLENKIIKYIENINEFTKLLPRFCINDIDTYISNILFASLMTMDVTELFNTNILYVNNYRSFEVTSEVIRKKLLSCFEIIEETENEIRLKFLL